MKSVVALLTATAIAISPAHAEPKQKPKCQQEASLVLELAVIAWMVGVSAYFLGDAYLTWSKYQKARGKHGPDVELAPKCEWVPVEKK